MHVWGATSSLTAEDGVPIRVLDGGREFIASTVREFLTVRGVTPVFVAKARAQPNCYMERFNASMHDELLHGERFRTLAEARVMITAGSSPPTATSPTHPWECAPRCVRGILFHPEQRQCREERMRVATTSSRGPVALLDRPAARWPRHVDVVG